MMEQTSDFENLKFDPFCVNKNILLNNLVDQDINLFNENGLQNLDTVPRILT